jgi:uncharacterized protein YggE
MNARTRRIGLIGIGLAVAGLSLAACGEPAQVDVQAPLDRGPDALPDGITVSGEGEVEGAPDTLSVDLGVTIKRDTVGDAVAASSERATAVIDAVKAQGVDDADVQTRNYSVNQEFRYPENGNPIPDGFRVNNTVTVRVRDLATAGAVIDEATAAGGDDIRVDTVSFSLENDGPALTAARDNAFRDAQEKAKQYAGLADVSLGRAQAISDVVVTPISETYTGDLARTYAATDVSTPIEAGEVTTRVTVNARFELG